MKITRITAYPLRLPLGEQRFFSSQCAFGERTSLLVRVDTDEGVYGWGEGGQYGPTKPVMACVQQMAPAILGENPLHIEGIWHKLYSLTRDYGQKGTYIEAMSAIDIALWDIAGKALGQHVSVLMGGRLRESVPAYATGCYYRGANYLDWRGNLSALAAEARGYIEAGFSGLKMKVGLLSVEEDSERVACVREAIGPRAKLFLDANHAYNGFTAARLLSLIEPHRVLWIEEPVAPEDAEGYRFLRARSPMAVAGGECEYTRYGFKQLFERGCVDIGQPDVCVCGGLTEFKKITTLASVYGVMIIPHVWGSGVALAAALAALANLAPFPHTANPVALQNEPMVEYDRNFNPLRDELLAHNIRLEDGGLAIPQGPGLGIEIDEAVLAKYLEQ